MAVPHNTVAGDHAAGILYQLSTYLDSNSEPVPWSGCRLWTGSLTDDGYGFLKVRADGKRIAYRAHRAAWVVAYGQIPDGLWVLHRCDVRCCIEPTHLYLGTVRDNHDDMVSRHRGVRSSNNLPFGVKRSHRSEANPFMAVVRMNGKKVYLGSFASVEIAAAVAAKFNDSVRIPAMLAARCSARTHQPGRATAPRAALSLLDVPPSVQRSTTSSLAGRGGDRLGVEE